MVKTGGVAVGSEKFDMFVLFPNCHKMHANGTMYTDATDHYSESRQNSFLLLNALNQRQARTT